MERRRRSWLVRKEAESDEIQFGDNSSTRSVIFQCRWTCCERIFQDINSLRFNLVEDHWPFYTDYGTARQDENAKTDTVVCGVENCDMELNGEWAFGRHALFHAFEAQRQFVGQAALIGRNETDSVEDCGHPGTAPVRYQGTPLVCAWNKCLASYDDMLEYVSHVDRHIDLLDSSDKQPGYSCLWLAKKGTLRWHLRHHSGDKTLACPFCARFFINKNKLIDHVIRKKDNGRLKCFLCHKTFVTERLLREHSRRHVKNYKCMFCDMTVECPSDLRDHMAKRHSKNRPHKCSLCEKAFFQKSDLDRHEAIHEERRRFPCSQCDKSFAWKKLLNIHCRKEHDPNGNTSPYICHLCADINRFQNGHDLSKHLINAHEIKLPSGHARFQYKKCEDGYLRLQTERYESVQLALQLEAADKGQSLAVFSQDDGSVTVYVPSIS